MYALQSVCLSLYAYVCVCMYASPLTDTFQEAIYHVQLIPSSVHSAGQPVNGSAGQSDSS